MFTQDALAQKLKISMRYDLLIAIEIKSTDIQRDMMHKACTCLCIYSIIFSLTVNWFKVQNATQPLPATSSRVRVSDDFAVTFCD